MFLVCFFLICVLVCYLFIQLFLVCLYSGLVMCLLYIIACFFNFSFIYIVATIGREGCVPSPFWVVFGFFCYFTFAGGKVILFCMLVG